MPTREKLHRLTLLCMRLSLGDHRFAVDLPGTSLLVTVVLPEPIRNYSDGNLAFWLPGMVTGAGYPL